MPEDSVAPAILVVEDESLLRMIAVDMFEEAGFRVIEAPTADFALQILDSGEPISGLFTDIETPGSLDGVTLAQITHDRHPGTAILVVSGRRLPGDGDLPPGAVFVGKPYSIDRVIGTLNGMIGESE